jgi:hypothetical protein
MVSDKERFEKVAIKSMVLCLILIMFPALKISSFGGKFMAQYDTFIMVFLIVFVFLYQAYLYDITKSHAVNNTIYSVLHILLLSSILSVVEVSLVSRTAATVILILWVMTFATIVDNNRKEISNIVVSGRNKRLIGTICVLSLVCNINCMVNYLIS